MAGKFEAQVRAFADKAKRRQTAIFRQSTQDVAQESNTPRGQGGKMPIDTGFLRASQAASKLGMPSGPGKGAAGTLYNRPLGIPVEVVLLNANLGDTVWVGWTANYAPVMEQRYGFMRSAAQNWQSIVDRVASDVRSRYT